MAKERLSKLQKWILTKCLEGKTINRHAVRKFYGKEYPPSYKDKEVYPVVKGVIKGPYIETKAEEVAISRTLKNLKIKGLLEQISKWGNYYLTEKGFLIVNKLATHPQFINYKEYKEAIDQIIAEEKKRDQAYVNSFKEPSEEYQKKRLEQLKAKEEEFYRLFNSYSEGEFIRLYFDITSNRVKPSHKIKKLIRLKNEILTLNQGWLHNALYEEYKDIHPPREHKVYRFSPQGYLLNALLNIELELEEKKKTLLPQFSITPIDRTTAQDFLPAMMNKAIFSGYTTLSTSDEIINKEKKRLNKEDLTFEEERKVLTQAKEYKSGGYVIRDYGSYAIGFASQIYIDRIVQTEEELNNEPRKTLLTPYLFDNMNKNIEEALKRIKLYKLAHRLAYIILSEGYIQNTWKGLVIPKIKSVELLGYSTSDKQIYQDIKESLYSLLWVNYKFWDYQYTDRKKKHTKEKGKAIGYFIYNLNEDSKNYTFDINEKFVGCVGELINDKLPRTRKARQEAFNRGYFRFPTRMLPLTRDYNTPAYLLTHFLVRETGNQELNKDGFKIIAYKIEKYIKEANIQHLRSSRRYRNFIQALEQVEIIHKTEPTIEKLKELLPTAGIKTMLYVWILQSPKALDQDIKNKLISKKK